MLSGCTPVPGRRADGKARDALRNGQMLSCRMYCLAESPREKPRHHVSERADPSKSWNTAAFAGSLHLKVLSATRPVCALRLPVSFEVCSAIGRCDALPCNLPIPVAEACSALCAAPLATFVPQAGLQPRQQRQLAFNRSPCAPPPPPPQTQTTEARVPSIALL
jgi:hypothetical protein